MHSISAKLGHDVCNTIVGMHALTGCDSTSAFVGNGKKIAFDLVKQSSKFQAAMS